MAANTGTGEHDTLADYRTEDPRISTVRWKAVRGGFNYAAAFANSWMWAVRSSFQVSPDVLISGEQFGLGGLGTVRGTKIDRPITADKGLAATLEITTPELRPSLRAVGFVDAGWLANNDPNASTKPASDRLVSVGVGMRYGVEPFAVSLDYGRLVTGSGVPLSVNSSSPQRGDDRVYLNFSWRF